MLFIRLGSARIVGHELRFEGIDTSANQMSHFVLPLAALAALDRPNDSAAYDPLVAFRRHRASFLRMAEALAGTALPGVTHTFVLDERTPMWTAATVDALLY